MQKRGRTKGRCVRKERRRGKGIQGERGRVKKDDIRGNEDEGVKYRKRWRHGGRKKGRKGRKGRVRKGKSNTKRRRERGRKEEL